LLTSVIILFVGAVGGDINPPATGLKPGDWVIYRVTRLGPSNQAWGPYPDAFWIKVEVLNVSWPTLTFREICNNGGSESTSDFTGDFYTTKIMGPLNYFLAPNLVPGDVLFRDGTFEIKLNDTLERNYLGVTREVNHVAWTGTMTDPFIGSPLNYTTYDYWDKTTGFLLEMQMQEYHVKYGALDLSTFGLTVEDTNLWPVQKQQSPSPMLLLVPVGLVVATLAVFELRRRSVRKEERLDKDALKAPDYCSFLSYAACVSEDLYFAFCI
jgi:hypothetical protein